jgi:CTP synthase (UTP-ammonia lyase)
MVKLNYRLICKFKFVAVHRSYVDEPKKFLTAHEKTLQSSVMGLSRLEVNLRRLLCQCENMAKEDLEKDWRLDKVQIFMHIKINRI